jgi:hypothetical protein
MEKFKIVKEKKDLYIEFSEEELQELGWKDNQKLSLDVEGNSIMIKPWVNVEIDTTDWPKEIYQMLVDLSLEQDKTVNEIIVDLITKAVNKNTTKEQLICE